MIKDSLSNSSHYVGLHPLFGRAFDGLSELLSRNRYRYRYRYVEDGVYEIIGGEDPLLTITLVSAPLRDVASAQLEVHDKYIDIQVVLDGVEQFGVVARGALTRPVGVYDQQKDILFFDDTYHCDGGGRDGLFSVGANEFVVFFPWDSHAPLVGAVGQTVRKAIIKVRV